MCVISHTTVFATEGSNSASASGRSPPVSWARGGDERVEVGAELEEDGEEDVRRETEGGRRSHRLRSGRLDETNKK